MSKYKTIRRVVQVTCSSCNGLGITAKNNGAEFCETCNGTGVVEKVINEIVHDLENEHARPN